MGKAWDGGDVAFRPETWAAVMRVLRPGGHMLACGGTRTYDQLVHAIRQSGFEVRDCVLWVYGSGFNKVGYIRDSEGQIVKEGWAGSIKPAVELICLARKPLSEGTIAANVLRWGTGALNIDGCRVGFGSDQDAESARPGGRATGKPFSNLAGDADDRAPFVASDNAKGRWPANLIHDGSAEVLAAFPETQPGANASHLNRHDSKGLTFSHNGGQQKVGHEDNGGSAARFFKQVEPDANRLWYSSKADADDRLGSKHPTVKPVDLIQYLARLITPPSGVILDCFAGTGTLGETAIREGFRAVLIEREAEYCADIRRRMTLASAGPVERRHESIKARGKVDHDAGPLFAQVEAIA